MEARTKSKRAIRWPVKVPKEIAPTKPAVRNSLESVIVFGRFTRGM